MKRGTKPKFDSERASDFVLVTEVGNPLSAEGLTRAILSGTGDFRVEHVQGGEEARPADAKKNSDRFEFGAETAQTLLARVARFPWNRTFPSRPGVPDEPILVWTFVDRRGSEVSLKMWLRDAEEDEDMAWVVSALRQGVDAATAGRQYL